MGLGTRLACLTPEIFHMVMCAVTTDAECSLKCKTTATQLHCFISFYLYSGVMMAHLSVNKQVKA